MRSVRAAHSLHNKSLCTGWSYSTRVVFQGFPPSTYISPSYLAVFTPELYGAVPPSVKAHTVAHNHLQTPLHSSQKDITEPLLDLDVSIFLFCFLYPDVLLYHKKGLQMGKAAIIWTHVTCNRLANIWRHNRNGQEIVRLQQSNLSSFFIWLLRFCFIFNVWYHAIGAWCLHSTIIPHTANRERSSHKTRLVCDPLRLYWVTPQAMCETLTSADFGYWRFDSAWRTREAARAT